MTDIIKVFDGVEITLRPEDQFWNATEMCKVSKKKRKDVADFLRLNATKEYIAELAEDLGVPAESLVEVRKGGRDGKQGTWMHEDLAFELAGWINPKFRLWVNRVAKKLIRDKVVHLEDEIDNLKAALGDSEAMIVVRELQASEARAEAGYWKEELTLYREGHHPDYQQIGGYQDNSND